MRTLAVVTIAAAVVAALCALYWIAGELHYQSCLRAPQPASERTQNPWDLPTYAEREPRCSRLPR